MSEAQKKLKELSKGKISNWVKKTADRLSNRKWLRYSSNIAVRILAAIEDREDLTQAKLAQKLNVSPQRVSEIVKGKENLTLQTIANISEVLGVELISFPAYKYTSARQTSAVLSELYSNILHYCNTPLFNPSELKNTKNYYVEPAIVEEKQHLEVNSEKIAA